MAHIDASVILEHTADGFLGIDTEWCVHTTNRAVEMLFQQATPAVAGADLWTMVPDLAGSRAERELRDVAAGRVARRIEHFAPSRYSWFEFHAIPRPDGLYLFIRNITDRARQAQSDAVRAAVQAIIMDAPVAMSITRGPEHRYDLVNARSMELVAGRNFVGRTIRSAFPELEGSPLLDLLDTVYQTGVPYTGRNTPVLYDRAGDGTLVQAYFDFTYQPLLEADGKVWGILTVAVDVTEYIAARTEAEAPRAIPK